MIDLRRFEDPAAFLADAEPWLLESEVEHTLILGVARQLCASIDPYVPPIYFATIRRDRQVVGCAYRTPPFKFVVTRMPLDTVPALVDDAARIYGALPAAMGPEPAVGRFAELWCARRDVRSVPGTEERIYQLSQVIPPERLPPGRLRPARPADRDVVMEWFDRFMQEAAGESIESRSVLEARVNRGGTYLWDDGGPVAMASTTGRSPHGVRITDVYTPPESRGRGYASAAVAGLSQLCLDDGLEFCCLYTDLSNPTSNSIYQRIGYRPVLDVSDIRFLPA